MSRKIKITKYQENTHYSVYVIDSYGTEHHLGYLGMNLTIKDIDRLSEEIWSNEVKPKEDLLGKAIKECIEIDRKAGRLPSLD